MPAQRLGAVHDLALHVDGMLGDVHDHVDMRPVRQFGFTLGGESFGGCLEQWQGAFEGLAIDDSRDLDLAVNGISTVMTPVSWLEFCLDKGRE